MAELRGDALRERHTPTTARGRATRERILDAAAGLILQRGVAAVTLDEVERAAEVGRSRLYHYFDDRDDVIRSVVRATVDTVLAAQEPLLQEVGSLAGIDRWFDAIVANGTRQDAGGRLRDRLVGRPAQRPGRPHPTGVRGRL
ncbi:TetR/AcrR family transcriptional regulator [Amycolatopsis sp. NPDC049252]|uniref:TetR/AcrR family transcriptional regulator n=1 Tax=Amycolatopsis sp. NPDC049252 TaxID=3363933 RepID=UPI003711E297